MQQPQPLCPEISAELSEACDVSARPVEARNQADLHWIGRVREDNWNFCGGRFRRECGGGATSGRDNRYLALNQIGSQGWQAIELIVCPAIFDRNILAFGIAGLLQTLPEGGDT